MMVQSGNFTTTTTKHKVYLDLTQFFQSKEHGGVSENFIKTPQIVTDAGMNHTLQVVLKLNASYTTVRSRKKETHKSS